MEKTESLLCFIYRLNLQRALQPNTSKKITINNLDHMNQLHVRAPDDPKYIQEIIRAASGKSYDYQVASKEKCCLFLPKTQLLCRRGYGRM